MGCGLGNRSTITCTNISEATYRTYIQPTQVMSQRAPPSNTLAHPNKFIINTKEVNQVNSHK